VTATEKDESLHVKQELVKMCSILFLSCSNSAFIGVYSLEIITS